MKLELSVKEKNVKLVREYNKTSIIGEFGNTSDITGPKYKDLVQHVANYNFDPNSPILKKRKKNINKNFFFHQKLLIIYFRSD